MAQTDDGERRVHLIRFIDESRFYRRIPFIKRLVPSLQKRIERFLYPDGRTVRAAQIRVVNTGSAFIHIFGDSHSGLFKSMLNAAVYYIGPITMHRVGRDGIGVFGFDALDIKNEDALGFVFGEIDVRVHVANQRDRFGRQPDEIIDALAATYLSTLRTVKDRFPLSPLIVFSVIPPAGHNYPNFNHHKLDYPQTGGDHERVEWTLQLNERLRRGALEVGFGFVDQYTPFANKRGLLDRRMTADGLHAIPNPTGKDVEELLCEFKK